MHRSLAAILATAFLAACSATVEIPSATSAKPLHLGAWKSELDGTLLVIEEDGRFTVERPAVGAEPARGVIGRWRLDDGDVVFANAADAATCAGVDGRYAARVVRDTARFVEIDDDCPAREEHMAWPWKRAAKP
ncbi:MAG: hypothetical protein ACKO0W_08015 [Planctomycetota bacterium]